MRENRERMDERPPRRRVARWVGGRNPLRIRRLHRRRRITWPHGQCAAPSWEDGPPAMASGRRGWLPMPDHQGDARKRGRLSAPPLWHRSAAAGVHRAVVTGPHGHRATRGSGRGGGGCPERGKWRNREKMSKIGDCRRNEDAYSTYHQGTPRLADAPHPATSLPLPRAVRWISTRCLSN